jgi:membrane protease YdiL (CAAX protease family)
MDTITGFVKRYSVIIFFILAYLFSWSFWPLFNLGKVPTPILPLGPVIAALIVVPIVGGKAGFKAWASRIVRWRVGLRWYAVAIFLPILMVLTAVLINILLGAPVPTREQLSIWPSLWSELLFIVLFVDLGEEPGFRGFALPRLQSGRTALLATLILAVGGVIWHLPLFFTGDSPWTNIPLIVAGYFMLTWLFNNTNGSVLMTMIMHTMVNIAGPSYFATFFEGADRVRYDWLLSGTYVVVALAIIVFAGYARLSRKPAAQLDRVAEPAPIA